MKVGYVQLEPFFGEAGHNIAKLRTLISGVDADLLVLPELFNTGYVFTSRQEVASLAEEPGNSHTIDSLLEIALENDMHLAAGFAEKDGSDCYNSMVLLGPEGVVGIYRKLHLFKDEKEWFRKGESSPEVYRIRGIRVGLMVCFDWIFPETARMLSLKGADIICHGANLVLPWCQKATITRAIENGVFIVLANRIGMESRAGIEMTFTGGSEIVDPRGGVLVAAPLDREDVRVVEIDPFRARDKHVTPVNDLHADRREDIYRLMY